eukprot:36336-Rhodomonas_salina.3
MLRKYASDHILDRLFGLLRLSSRGRVRGLEDPEVVVEVGYQRVFLVLCQQPQVTTHVSSISTIPSFRIDRSDAAACGKRHDLMKHLQEDSLCFGGRVRLVK